MGFCSKRYFFLSVCLLQMFSVIQRQVFDFLGFLWIPILVNFFQIIFIILGFFGAYQYRPKYIISYLIWHLFWLGWNIFLICLYLNVGSLDHKSNIVLKLDSKSESWWGSEGPGCKKIPVHDEPWQADVENCLVNYVHVEIFQAGLQCVLSLISTMIGMCLSRAFMEEDDTFNYEDAKGPEHLFLHPMYVSSSDNLNQHFSKSNSKCANVKSRPSFTPLASKKFQQRKSASGNNKYKPSKVAVDAVRFPVRRTASFDVLKQVNRRRAVRPKSMCSSSNFDSDLVD